MRILLDCDGVLADHDTAFRDALLSTTGRNHTYTEVTNWDYKKCLNLTDEEEATAWRCLNAFEFEPYPGAVDGVRSLEAEGHEIVFVTAPSPHIPEWTWWREMWLRKHFGEDVKVIHTKHKQHIAGDALIDDKTENIKTWVAEQKALGIIFARPWNVPVYAYNICRSNDWNVITKLLRPAKPSELDLVAYGRAP